MGNIFASYKYIVTNSVADLQYFKDPIFIWTNLPDKMTTVIVTYIVGAILPIIALLMTSTLADFINGSDASLESPDDTIDVQPNVVKFNTDDTSTNVVNESTTVDTVDTSTVSHTTDVDDTSLDNVGLDDTNTVTTTVVTQPTTVDNAVSDSATTTDNEDNTDVDDSTTAIENKPEPNRFINI